MKKSLILFATFVVSAFVATADERPIGERLLPRFLRQFDTNEDGMIDEEERQAIADLRTKLRENGRKSIDVDRDGQVNRDEIEAAREILRQQIEERRLEKFHEIAGEDEVISKVEYRKIPGSSQLPEYVFEGIFARLDSDGSGDISAKEFLDKLKEHRVSARH